jgi:hypothetical protein
LPQRIRREVETKKRNPRSNAVLAQMAAAIALLQAAPIRLKNLTGLNLTDNLIARAKSFYLVIGEHHRRTPSRSRASAFFKEGVSSALALQAYRQYITAHFGKN